MPLIQTTVANMALGLIGSKRIEDIDSTDDDVAVDCRFWLEPCIKEMGATAWSQFRAIADLPAETAAPAFGFEKRYKVPSDCMMVLKVNGYDAESSTVTDSGDAGAREPLWRRFGRHIHTNDTVCKIEYLKYDDATSLMDGPFVAALATLMASYLAPTLRNDGGKRGDELRARYERFLLPRARVANGNENNRRPANVTKHSRLIGYRRKGTAYRSLYEN